MMEIYDITIPLSTQTPVWEGEKGVTFSQEEYISQGADFNVSRIEMGVHAGTHIDAPFHLFNDGQTVDQIPIDKLVGRVQVIHILDEVKRITADVFKRSGIGKDIKHLLFKTKNSAYWKNEPCHFSKEYVALDSSAAEYLVSLDIKLAGIDWFSMSPIDELKPPHEILLKAGVVILENINLWEIKPGIYNLYCLPLKLVGADGAPARVILTRD